MVLGLLTISLISFGLVSTPAEAAVPLAPVPRDNVPVAPVKYLAPTQNLTKLANAIQWTAQSLSILVVVPPGLRLSQPVQISIGYYSQASDRQTQFYRESGNQFLYNDPEGAGQPRGVLLHITLTEAKPGGGFYTYNLPVNVKLDPLYDVTISPLVFTLMTDCALIGNSDIEFYWLAPDGVFKRATFATSAGTGLLNGSPGGPHSVREFAWARAEVSASAKFGQPFIYEFYSGGFRHGTGPVERVNLVPGVTRRVVQNVREQHQQCDASVAYNITYALRLFSAAELLSRVPGGGKLP